MSRDQKKVVWFEGMTLDPHHFQQWDRYITGLIEARVGSAAPFAWGVSQLAIDEDRLANGELALIRCRGVMPDGLPFDLPGRDRLPPPRNVAEVFPAADEHLRVYLAVPAERRDGANILLKGAERRRQTRYTAATMPVVDENTGSDERDLEVAESNFELLFEGEPMESFTTLPVADVDRRIEGGFQSDDKFVPPALQISASDRLVGLTRRLLDALVTRSSQLVDRRAEVFKQRELSPADVKALGLLSSVNRYIPVLKQYHELGRVHPERLYMTMLQLAGELLASVDERGPTPQGLPVYDHANPSGCFNPLDEVLHRMLGGAEPSANYRTLSLERTGENQYRVAVEEELLQRAQFFLVIASDRIAEERLVSEIPEMLRVASPETLDGVLRSSTRALPLEHTHRLPAGMPIDHQSNYFQLEKRGPFWEGIVESASIAIFVPSEFADLRMEFVAVENP